jgi:hypothetical protein
MQHKINNMFTIIAITAFGMISAPTLSNINTIFAQEFNPFDFLNSQSTSDRNPSNIKIPGLENLFSSPDNSAPSSDNSAPSSSSNDGKCIQTDAAGGTKDYYCAGTHHHCKKGTPDCLLEGGRTS